MEGFGVCIPGSDDRETIINIDDIPVKKLAIVVSRLLSGPSRLYKPGKGIISVLNAIF